MSYITSEYPIKTLSSSAFKIYSVIVLQIKKSKVDAEWVELSFTQLQMKTGLSYSTISKCVNELCEFEDIVVVKKKNGTTTMFKPNKDIII